MNETISPSKRRCQAMIDAGIEDPDSEEGCLFCAGNRQGDIESQCPYDHCVVFEGQARTSMEKAARKGLAIRLHYHGVSVKDIALIVGKKVATVRSYLRK